MAALHDIVLTQRTSDPRRTPRQPVKRKKTWSSVMSCNTTQLTDQARRGSTVMFKQTSPNLRTVHEAAADEGAERRRTQLRPKTTVKLATLQTGMAALHD